MRGLRTILLLLLLSTVVLFWEVAPKPERAGQDPTGTPVVPQRTDTALMSTPAPAPRSPAELPLATADTAGLHYKTCLRLGPFASQLHATSARRWLERRRAHVWVHEAAAETAHEYLVFTSKSEQPPARPSLPRSAGSPGTDASSIRSIPIDAIVVLGRYTTEAEASQRLAELNRRGIHAGLNASTRVRSNFWLDAGSERGVSLLEETESRFRDRARATRIDCGELSSGKQGACFLHGNCL